MTTSPRKPETASSVQPDAALLGLIADFHKAYSETPAARDKWTAEKGRVEALPDCPSFVAPALDQAGYDRHCAFMKEHGVTALYDRFNELEGHAGALANQIFATPAYTLVGAVEKLKIVRLARGDDGDTADNDLEAYQYDSQERWFAGVMRDFDRLAGESGDEPLVALYAKWHALEWRRAPEGLTEDETERFHARTGDEADAVSVEIIGAPAKTLIGAYAQIALLKFWDENGVPDRLEAALARFYGHVEAALQGAGRTGGGEDPVVQIVQTLPAMFDKLTRLEIKEVKQGEALRWSGTYYDLIRATEGVIAQTPATSLEGALAQIAIANACVHEIEDSVEDNLRHDRAVAARSLLYSAVSAIETATGARRPEVTARHHMIDDHNPLMGAAATPDPAVELAREHQTAINRLNTPGEISDDDTNKFMDNVVVPLEEKLARTRPTSREGIMALLDVAAAQARRESDETPASWEAMIIGVMQNARDAIKAGVA